MNSYKKPVSAVDRILWEEWDPIGVNDMPAAREEYSSYVPGIVRLLRDGADEAQIARHLQTIEEISLTMEVYDERRRRVAGKIVSLRNAE